MLSVIIFTEAHLFCQRIGLRREFSIVPCMSWHYVISGCFRLSSLILRNVFSLNSERPFCPSALFYATISPPDSLTTSLIFHQMARRVFSLHFSLIMYLFNLSVIYLSLRWSLVCQIALLAFNSFGKNVNRLISSGKEFHHDWIFTASFKFQGKDIMRKVFFFPAMIFQTKLIASVLVCEKMGHCNADFIYIYVCTAPLLSSTQTTC